VCDGRCQIRHSNVFFGLLLPVAIAAPPIASDAATQFDDVAMICIRCAAKTDPVGFATEHREQGRLGFRRASKSHWPLWNEASCSNVL